MNSDVEDEIKNELKKFLLIHMKMKNYKEFIKYLKVYQ